MDVFTVSVCLMINKIFEGKKQARIMHQCNISQFQACHPPPPPGRPMAIHNILVAPGVGFSLLCLARGSALGEVLNQSKSSIISKKSTIFALPLKQMSSSSFHTFIYARSEQCDLGPIYTITNTQRIRIYPGKLKSILVKISSDPGR